MRYIGLAKRYKFSQKKSLTNEIYRFRHEIKIWPKE